MFKESVIKFLKPDWRKLFLFALLMGGLNYWWISGSNVLDARVLFGLPLPFYPKGGFNLNFGGTPPTVKFSWLNFIIDIVFWYLVACIVFYSYEIIKNKRKKKK